MKRTYRVEQFSAEMTPDGPIASAKLVRWPSPWLFTVWIDLKGSLVDTVRQAYLSRSEITFDDTSLPLTAQAELLLMDKVDTQP